MMEYEVHLSGGECVYVEAMMSKTKETGQLVFQDRLPGGLFWTEVAVFAQGQWSYYKPVKENG